MRRVERRERSSAVWLMCYLLPTLENSTSSTQNPLHCILQSMHLPADSNSEILTTANYDFCLLYCTQRDCTTSGADDSPASVLKQTQTMGFEHAGSRTHMCYFIWHTWHVARMGERRGVYRVLVGKPEENRPLGRPRYIWEDNIKLNLQGVWCGIMDWIEVAQNRDRWRALVNAVMNLRVP